MAAEYYLRMKRNGENKKDLLKEARYRYNGCVSTSVFLFNLLSQEQDTPNGYTQWLTGIFKNKKLPKEAIEHHLDEIVPKSPSEKFFDNLFDSFRRIISKIASVQARTKFEAINLIENIVNQNFVEIAEISVYYCQERQSLPNAINIKEIHIDNLFINIAEYASREAALTDKLNNRGANITPSMEEINGERYPLYYVNLAPMSNIVTTVGTSFVKDNLKISFTVNCPDYVVRTNEEWEDLATCVNEKKNSGQRYLC